MIGKIDTKQWMDGNVEWLKKEFGAKNFLRFDMHWHESTPHMHAFVSPLDERGNFNFKKYVRHISQSVQMQDRYADAMKEFGLERGKTRWQEYGPDKPMKAVAEQVRHRLLRAWRSQLIEECAKMKEDLALLSDLDN